MARVKRGKALVASLRAQAGVRDPEALAAYLGRFKKARKAGRSVAEAAKVAKGGDSSNGSAKPRRREDNDDAQANRLWKEEKKRLGGKDPMAANQSGGKDVSPGDYVYINGVRHRALGVKSDNSVRTRDPKDNSDHYVKPSQYRKPTKDDFRLTREGLRIPFTDPNRTRNDPRQRRLAEAARRKDEEMARLISGKKRKK